MKNLVLTTVALLALSQVTQAAIMVEGALSGVPTPGKDGYTTFTLTAVSDEGNIIGFNFDRSLPGGGDSGLGIRGDLAQENPFGSESIFDDIAGALWTAAGIDPAADSRFLTKSANGLKVNAFEDGGVLSAAFNFNAGGGAASLPFAQVVIPTGSTATYLGDFTVAGTGGNALVRVEGVIGIPEPGTICLAGMSLLGLVLRRRS